MACYVLTLPQATDTPHFLHVINQTNLRPQAKFRVGEEEECKPICAQKEKNWKQLNWSELVSLSTTERETMWPLLETDVSETIEHSLSLSATAPG